MKNIKVVKHFAIVGLMAGVVGSAAFAANHQSHDGAKDRGARMEAFWQSLDADGDGYLSLQEIERMPAVRLSKLAGENGEIDIAAVTEKMDARRVQHRQERGAKHFARMDKNGDGIVDAEELSQAKSAFEKRLSRHSSDASDSGHGRKSQERLARMSAWFEGLKAPMDEAAFLAQTREAGEQAREAKRGSGRGMAARLSQYDTDGNGVISETELNAVTMPAERAQAIFDKADRSGDGKVTVAEAQAAMKALYDGRKAGKEGGHARHHGSEKDAE